MSEEGAAGGGQGEQGLRLSKSAPLAQALVETIHAGEVESLIELLREHPGRERLVFRTFAAVCPGAG